MGKKAQAPKKAAAKKTKKEVKKVAKVKDAVKSKTPENVVAAADELPSKDTPKIATKANLSLMKDLVGSDNLTLTCELSEDQVVKAVGAAFKAQEISQKKVETGKLFDDEPEPVNLLVSAIKVPDGPPLLFDCQRSEERMEERSQTHDTSLQRTFRQQKY